METGIDDRQQEVIRKFESLDDWMDMYVYLIELGNTLPPMEDGLKNDDNTISGCQSQVWMDARVEAGQVHFQADSDTRITKGLIALLLRVLNRQPPRSIVEADLYFIERIGLSAHLSPARANGLASIIRQIKQLALPLADTHEGVA